jgi:hypothetical protein
MMQVPSFTAVQGPSYPVAIKLLASVGMVALLFAAWGARDALMALSVPPELLMLAGLASLFVTWQFLNILLATTAITADTLSQGWLWRHGVKLSDISQVRLLRFRPLDRWMVPRLMVRTRGLGNVTFQVADPRVLAVVELLVHGRQGSEGIGECSEAPFPATERR